MSEVKPILKKTSIVEGKVPDAADKRHMKWDEKNLKENADYMEANPKTKIEEPDTPFVKYDMENDEELADDERKEVELEGDDTQDPGQRMNARMVILESKLKDVVEHPDSTSPHGTPEAHDKDFKLKRKAVYADEGAKFKDLLKRGACDDDDEDEGSK
eukprot:TRINITY_DN1125_c0_g1_i2.p2 TRINITY_DN1125_c0_g1~~TRINITY_DN1125_c0_g1_i2.p2  ORF type:complete len:158 (+),score=73.34 TRINITY_DN1125_c0_g1_i2:1219-1692(+)